VVGETAVVETETEAVETETEAGGTETEAGVEMVVAAEAVELILLVAG
jgi:hypothetical protein